MSKLEVEMYARIKLFSYVEIVKVIKINKKDLLNEQLKIMLRN